MEGTCSNPWASAANDGIGFVEKTRLFVLGGMASVFTKTGEWIRWFFVIYVILAVCLCAALVMHSLIQYAISIWKITIKNTIQFRQHTAMRLVWALLCLIGSLVSAVLMSALWPLWVPIAMTGILWKTAVFAYKTTIFAYKTITFATNVAIAFAYKTITFATNVAIAFATKVGIWIAQHTWEAPWSLSIWLRLQARLGGRWGFQLIWKTPAPPTKHLPPPQPLKKTYAATLQKLNDFYDAEEDGTLKKPNYHYDVDDEDFFEPETPYNPADFVDADNRTYTNNDSSSSISNRDNIPVVPPYSPPQEKTQKQH